MHLKMKTETYFSIMKYSNLVGVLVAFMLLSAFDWTSYIKEHEGLVLHEYNCPAGVRTVGYGHVIKAGEHFNRITKKAADSLLLADFTAASNAAKRLHPQFTREQYEAVGHLIYSVGIGNYTKSRLYKALLNNAHQDLIYEYWMDFAYLQGNLNMRKLRNRNLEFIKWNSLHPSSTLPSMKKHIPTSNREKS